MKNDRRKAQAYKKERKKAEGRDFGRENIQRKKGSNKNQ